MILRLNCGILNEPWYPKDRQFTAFEARMDYLLNQGLLTPSEAAARWGWREEEVLDLYQVIQADGQMPPKASMYEKEENAKQMAVDVALVFNQVFERKIGVNTKRERQVAAILKEGKKMGDPIGVRQFRAVFEYKKAEWKGTDQEKYLEFETLCSDKFFKYLDAARLAYQKAKQQQNPNDGIKLTGSIVRHGGR